MLKNSHLSVFGWLLIAITLFFGANSKLQAQTDTQNSTPHSLAEFISLTDGIELGQKEILLGLEIQLEDHWHTYWTNPGDSAMPAKFGWTLPEGFTVTETIWPAPERITVDSLETFGYEKQVLAVFKVAVPDGLKLNQVLDFELNVRFLVCKEICLPAKTNLSLSLSVKEKTQKIAGLDSLFTQTLNNIQNFASDFKFNHDENFYWLEIQLAKDQKPLDFFADYENNLANSPPQITDLGDNKWQLKLKKSNLTFENQPKNSGLLVVDANGIQKYFRVLLEQKNFQADLALSDKKPATNLKTNSDVQNQKTYSFFGLILFAFLGGLILNAMPCVLPVLSIKFLSLTQSNQKSPAAVRLGALAYAAGVVSFFVLLSLILVFLTRTLEISAGWGFQLQSPPVLIGLIFLFTFLSFNFLGFFEINLPGTNLNAPQKSQGLTKQFFTGALSVIVASPCTAPFMGGVIGFAFTQDLFTIILTFTFLGLGLSFPFLLFAISPNLKRFLPKPGDWMVKLKEFMAFPLLATVAWLIWVLLGVKGGGKGADYGLVILLSLVGFGFGLWLWVRSKKLVIKVFAALILFVSIAYPATYQEPPKWQSFTPKVLTKAIANNERVFIDFTASWCITCQVNKKTTLDTQKVQKFFKDQKILTLRADWTDQNETIGKVLTKYQRAGVPLYLFFNGKDEEPIILNEVLTPSYLMSTIETSIQKIGEEK